jgi:hypothetical protein
VIQKRTTLALLSVGIIAVSLAVRSPSSEAAASRGAALFNPSDSSVAADLTLTLSDKVAFELTVTNNTDRKVELRFPNGQTHDLVVLDSIGREVWRWSEGKLYTQVVQNRVVDKHQSITFRADWKKPDTTGTFTAVAQLSSRNYPLEQRVIFDIPR